VSLPVPGASSAPAAAAAAPAATCTIATNFVTRSSKPAHVAAMRVGADRMKDLLNEFSVPVSHPKCICVQIRVVKSLAIGRLPNRKASGNISGNAIVSKGTAIGQDHEQYEQYFHLNSFV
jgi:hypothetical protein